MSQSNDPVPITEQVSKIKSIKYFNPARTLTEAKSLIPKIDELIEGYIAALGQWRQGANSLQHTSDLLWDLARVAAIKSGRTNTWDSAWDYAWKEASSSARDNYGWYAGSYAAGETARDAARDAAKYAARYIVYESVKDTMKGTNPFDFIMDLYLLGLKPTYFRMVNEQEKFIVDLPLKNGNDLVLGCYAHGDGLILFTHKWKDYCSSLLAVNENPPARTIT